MDRAERIGALDGIRCFAVLLAIGCHANIIWPSVRKSFFPFIESGFIGVDIFFVLSGFLISGLLLSEFQRARKIRYFKFFARRILRLLPPMAICLALTLAWAYIQGDDLQKFIKGVYGAVFNYFNWLLVFNKTHPKQLEHLWSLSIEEQLYILIAVIFLLLTKTRLQTYLTVSLFWTSLALIAWTVYSRFTTVSAGLDSELSAVGLYFRTDHRFGEFFFGVIAQLYKSKHRHVQTRLIKLVQYPAIIFLIFYATQANGDKFYLQYGSPILSLTCACVILSSTYEESPLFRFFSLKIFSSIGRISYSMYLSHFPIFYALSELPFRGPYKFLVAMALVFLYSVVVYFAVEKPLGTVRHKYLSS